MCQVTSLDIQGPMRSSQVGPHSSSGPPVPTEPCRPSLSNSLDLLGNPLQKKYCLCPWHLMPEAGPEHHRGKSLRFSAFNKVILKIVLHIIVRIPENPGWFF